MFLKIHERRCLDVYDAERLKYQANEIKHFPIPVFACRACPWLLLQIANPENHLLFQNLPYRAFVPFFFEIQQKTYDTWLHTVFFSCILVNFGHKHEQRLVFYERFQILETKLTDNGLCIFGKF
nr:hypothetical protein [Desulfotignum phosphitoxidans]